MSTVDKVGNRRSYVNLAQLYIAIRRKQDKKFIQYAIDKQHDINYQIPATDFLRFHSPGLIGSTALHLALSHDNFEIFNFLLKNHADYSVKNSKQITVLRRSIEENFKKRAIAQLQRRFQVGKMDLTADDVNAFVVIQRVIEADDFNKHENWQLWGKFEDKYVNAVLSVCLDTKKVLKSSDDDGISLLHAACLTNNIEAVNFLLKNGADVHALSSSPIFNGFTPLHFAIGYSSVELVKTLLNSGANVFSYKYNIMSAVDMLIDKNLKVMEWLHAKYGLPYKNSISDYCENEEKLQALMNKDSRFEWTGFSGFHVACTMTNASSFSITCLARDQLTFNKFLEGNHWHAYNRVSSISTDHPWSGFTALHFAAFFNVDTAKLLIENGADVEAKNKFGVTPLDILSTRAKIGDLYFIVCQKESWKCIVLSDGKTRLLDLMACMIDLGFFESFFNKIDFDVNMSIPNDAPLWPGYTVLHLVVTFSETVKKVENIFHSGKSDLNAEYESCYIEQLVNYNIKIKECLKKNADVTIQDVQGRTPINLVFRQKEIAVANLLLQYQYKTINPTDDDNLSHLHIACLTIGNLDLVEKLLANGADVNAVIKSSFKWHCDYHRCISTDVFDLVGSTPLHLSISSENVELTKVLLANGANVNVKDASNLTPLHRIFIILQVWQTGNELHKNIHRSDISSFSMDVFQNLMSQLLSAPNLEESIVDDFGLSHLHIAIYEDNVEAVKKLLDLGSDINAVIRFPKNIKANNPLFVLSRYDGYTPLRMTFNKYMSQSEKYLLERGADFLVPQPDGTNQLFEKLKIESPKDSAIYVDMLKENEVLRRRLQDEFGWTMLHVACRLVDFQLANFALSIGVDVNFQTNEKSPLYPGNTALHVLLSCHDYPKKIDSIYWLLLANGANVMLPDNRGDTAIHWTQRFSRSPERLYATSIFQHIRDFSVNPMNHDGISVFHFACMKPDVDVIKKFLDHGIAVNEPIEFFSQFKAGYTPLHLAVAHRLTSPKGLAYQLQIVELLLKRGADVNVENAYGETPFHSVAKCDPPREAVYEMLVRCGADINVKNNEGRTPLELLLSSFKLKPRDLDFFLKRGCRMNVFNEITQVGYMSYLHYNSNDDEEDPKHASWRLALTCPSINEVDHRGRTIIHNLVSSSVHKDDLDAKIKYFVERNFDVDCQDGLGLTALHVAAQFRNYGGVQALLSHGCDVNALDSTGRTAFSYALENEENENSYHRYLIKIFARFVSHVIYRGLRVNDVNRRALDRAVNEFSVDEVEIEADYENIRQVKIGDTAYVLEDFLAETKAIVRYSRIAKEDREAIERFFTNTIEKYKFEKWRFLCRLQYRKALQRTELVENAKDALNVVIGFSLPVLCYDFLEKYLSNMDLRGLVIAATLESCVVCD